VRKLLLADDSVTIQRVIELTFADEDIQVLTAGDGEQAIARIKNDRPDIVLADIGMPKRSGYEVAAFVKAQPEFAHIPVLLLTGAFEPVDEGRAQAAGCDGVLVKPFEPQHVIARVRELLHGEHRQRSGSVTRAVSDVPRPAERLAPPRASAAHNNGIGFSRPDSGRASADVSLDDYFDRLDAAFANLGAPATESAQGPHPETMRGEGPVMEKDLDWFDTPAPAQPAPYEPAARPVIDPSPATFATPPSPVEWPLPQGTSIEPAEMPAPRASYAQPTPPQPAVTTETSGSAIADAFSALLAAEQGEPGAAPVRLTLTPSAPAVSDQLVEEITRRVVERLAPNALREVVADVVSDVSERLVREEIDRVRKQASQE
jgi:CheY-like chemotaxis protein